MELRHISKPFLNKIITIDESWRLEFITKITSSNLAHDSTLHDPLFSFKPLSKHASAFRTPVTNNEIENILNSTLHSLLGYDGITHGIIKQLPNIALESLVTICNNIPVLQTGETPEDWNKHIIIPLLKPNKDSKLGDLYGPITLLPSFAKLSEKLLIEMVPRKRKYTTTQHNCFVFARTFLFNMD